MHKGIEPGGGPNPPPSIYGGGDAGRRGGHALVHPRVIQNPSGCLKMGPLGCTGMGEGPEGRV